MNRIQRVGRTSLSLLVCGTLVHCASQASNEGQPTVLETPIAGRDASLLDPTRSFEPNPLHWVEVPKEQYAASIDSVHGNPQYLPDDHPLTRRAQFWVDAVYTGLQQNHAFRFRSVDGKPTIPRPQVRWMVKPSANAFVASLGTCYSVPVRFEGAKADAPPVRAGDIVKVSPKGTVGLWPRASVSCEVDRTGQPVRAEDVVRYLTEDSLVQGCTVRAEGGTVVLGANCKLGADVTTAGATGIMLDSTANWFVLHTGLAELHEREEHLVTAIAHELGHYFLSHGTVSKGHYNYFYRQTPESLVADRPAPDPALNALGKELLAISKVRSQPVEGQELHSMLFNLRLLLSTAVLIPACGAVDAQCHSRCSRLIELSTSKELKNTFGSFPQAVLKGPALELYREYEREMKSCLSSLPLYAEPLPRATQAEGPDGGVADAGPVDEDGGSTDNGPKASKDRVDVVSLRRAYWRTDVPASLEGVTAYTLVKQMSDRYFEDDQANARLYQRALDENLGYYTTEQEADNAGLQFLAMVGISPEAAIDHWFSMAQARVGHRLESDYDFGFDRCRALYDAEPRWTAQGKPVRVPIGSFGSIHHGDCYRIYNLDRLREAKAIVPGPSRLAEAQAVGGTWADLRRQALDVQKAAFPSTETKGQGAEEEDGRSEGKAEGAVMN